MNKAVALRYPEGADAPYISAVAKGKLSERVVDIARQNGVPVMQNGELADVLSLCSVGDYIPEETYIVLAKVFAFIEKVEKENINERLQENQLR